MQKMKEAASEFLAKKRVAVDVTRARQYMREHKATTSFLSWVLRYPRILKQYGGKRGSGHV